MKEVSRSEARISPDAMVHPSADVEAGAVVAAHARIWQDAQIRERALIGAGCIIGKGVYVGAGVSVGRNCKVQNYACLFEGARLEDGVFVGPQAILTNDRHPRAVNPDGSLKAADDWDLGQTVVRYGAAIGAGAIVLPGLEIGRWSLVAAGAVVTRDVPDHALVQGNPACPVGWVCCCGRKLDGNLQCPHCGRLYAEVEGTLRERGDPPPPGSGERGQA